tara:strand:+ start:843 stop:1781 length:939 start_codon:yes stop_codon:yes gene_type:complete
MLFKRLGKSITKIILPLLYKILQLLKGNTRAINFLHDKKVIANNTYDFKENIQELLKEKKLIGLDIGSQGGFNSDNYFPKKYNNFFQRILVDPLNNSLKNEKDTNIINKGFWSDKGSRKLYILGNRPGSSSMFEPDIKSLEIYGFKEKDFHLFDITKTKIVECDTLSSSLSNINFNNLDYLKIDTQGAELEILKGIGNYRPLIIKCEVQLFPMYKNIPSWTETVDFLNKLGYMISDWRKIGSHITRTPVEMDMIFIPNFSIDSGEKIIKEKEKEFIALMLISGQIKLLKKISKSLNLGHSEFYMKIKDKYFN